MGRTHDHVFAEIYGEVNYLKISNLNKNKQNKKIVASLKREFNGSVNIPESYDFRSFFSLLS